MILPRRTPPRYATLGSPTDSPLVSPMAAVESALASFVSASRSSWRARSRVIPSLRPAVANECCSPSKPKRSSIKRCSRSGSVRNALSTAPRRANGLGEYADAAAAAERAYDLDVLDVYHHPFAYRDRSILDYEDIRLAA
jgi:hypothetical protein